MDDKLIDIINYVCRKNLIVKYANIHGLKDKSLAYDLQQDLCLSWMESKDLTSLYDAYDKGKLDDYVFLTVKQNVKSKTSRFYYKYMRYLNVDEFQINDKPDTDESDE